MSTTFPEQIMTPDITMLGVDALAAEHIDESLLVEFERQAEARIKADIAPVLVIDSGRPYLMTFAGKLVEQLQKRDPDTEITCVASDSLAEAEEASAINQSIEGWFAERDKDLLVHLGATPFWAITDSYYAHYLNRPTSYAMAQHGNPSGNHAYNYQSDWQMSEKGMLVPASEFTVLEVPAELPEIEVSVDELDYDDTDTIRSIVLARGLHIDLPGLDTASHDILVDSDQLQLV